MTTAFEVGQRVIVISYAVGGETYRLGKVEKTTKLYAIVGGVKYRHAGDRAVGGGYWQPRIEAESPELLAKVERQRRQRLAESAVARLHAFVANARNNHAAISPELHTAILAVHALLPKESK